jgi:hypothetical protein
MSHRRHTTSLQLAGIVAGRSSYAGSWRFYAWRFI